MHCNDNAARIALVAAQNQALALTLDLEREKLAARASLIAAEIGGSHGCSVTGGQSRC